MKLSVIIPTWNRAERIAGALESVLSQTRPPQEIIVVDDGSSDATRETIAREFPEIRYCHQANRGVSSARNTGIAMASGDWIAFLDSDDRWQPRKLERQTAMLGARPQYRICHTDEIWIRNGRRVNPGKKHAKRGGFILRYCLPRCVISPSAILLHRDVLTHVGCFDEQLPACEDYDLWLRICALYPVLFIDEPLLDKHGGHEDQLSRRYWGMDRFRIQALEKLLRSTRLSAADYTATIDTLLEKIRILQQGAEKRGNTALAGTCREKRDFYTALLQRAEQPARTAALPVSGTA